MGDQFIYYIQLHIILTQTMHKIHSNKQKRTNVTRMAQLECFRARVFSSRIAVPKLVAAFQPNIHELVRRYNVRITSIIESVIIQAIVVINATVPIHPVIKTLLDQSIVRNPESIKRLLQLKLNFLFPQSETTLKIFFLEKDSNLSA